MITFHTSYEDAFKYVPLSEVKNWIRWIIDLVICESFQDCLNQHFLAFYFKDNLKKMQSFLAHLHKGHPQAKSKSKKLMIETPREPQKLIFGNAISKYGTDGQHGYDASRRVNLSVLKALEFTQTRVLSVLLTRKWMVAFESSYRW